MYRIILYCILYGQRTTNMTVPQCSFQNPLELVSVSAHHRTPRSAPSSATRVPVHRRGVQAYTRFRVAILISAWHTLWSHAPQDENRFLFNYISTSCTQSSSFGMLLSARPRLVNTVRRASKIHAGGIPELYTYLWVLVQYTY